MTQAVLTDSQINLECEKYLQGLQVDLDKYRRTNIVGDNLRPIYNVLFDDSSSHDENFKAHVISTVDRMFTLVEERAAA